MSEVSIGVAMTTFQGARFLAAQLESLLEQHRPPDDVVIVDDASTDGTAAIIGTFMQEAPFPVRFVSHEHNQGVSATVAEALRLLVSDVIVLADQDDLWDPAKLGVIEKAFAGCEVSGWFSDAELIDSASASLGSTAWQATNFTASALTELRTGGGLARLLYGMTVTGATMAVRRAVVQAALPLPRRVGGDDHLFLHDGWLALVAHLMGDLVAEPRCLTRYRQHPDQVTSMSMVTDSSARTTEVRSAGGLSAESARATLAVGALRRSSAALLPQRWGELTEIEEFLRTRLSGNLRSRTMLLLRGRYHRSARGLRSYLKDIVGPKVGT